MKKIAATLKSIIDGLGSYLAYYLWTAFLLWLGLYWFELYRLSFIQCLGGVIAFRQVVGLIRNPTDKHLKKDVPPLPLPKKYEKDSD